MAERVAERTAELEAVNRELEAFAYSVSHDLRAPLRSIDGFSQALLEDCGEQLDGTGQEYLARVRAASQRMGRLIDELLTLSRVTRRELRVERVDLSELARSVVEELVEADPGREVEVVVADGLVAQGDPGLLRQVLHNLLDNAFKFSAGRDRARIELAVDSSGGERVYSIRDNGAGFDMAFADKLFGAFQRLHRVSEFAGTGVGLATVQRIIHRHGGRIWAEAVVGEGATFYFTLGA
jgi:light-regulated signal transduction histidine kinase (bacteriophytochrome)